MKRKKMNPMKVKRVHMIKTFCFCLVVGSLILPSCTEQVDKNTPGSVPVESVDLPNELTEEELDLLDAAVDSNTLDLGEINADTYEEALEKLEHAIDSE